MKKSEPKPKNKVMQAKNKKARIEAMKEMNEINLRGSMGDIQSGRLVVEDGISIYFAHKRYMDCRKGERI